MKDYNIDLLFAQNKDAFAMEMEISSVHSNELRRMFPGLPLEHLNSYMHEINELHNFEGGKGREKSLEVFNFLKEHYKDKFPMGYDGYPSGGNHFHVFGINREKMRDKGFFLNDNLLACPLFAKFYKGKVYNRYNSHAHFGRYTNICNGSKGDFATFNSGSLEFRCNNVIDDRLLGYYQAICILSGNNKTLAPLTDAAISYLKQGCTDNRHRGGPQINGDIMLDEVTGFAIREGNKETISNNIKTVLQTLKDAKLNNSHDKLLEYCEEFNLLIKEEEC